jgi:amidohydrolase
MDENGILTELMEFRRELHRFPEVSGEEALTARRVKAFLEPLKPDRIVSNIGGHGMIAEYKGKDPGPSVMFRCELDALPISEKNDIPYASSNEGKGHLCGHDGHMAMVSGLAYHLNKKRPAKGRVLLLFQPSEETGKGADRMLKDPSFNEFKPDYIFAIHNLPGYPLNKVVLANSHFAAASRGMFIKLTGKSSHAAEPEKGINPGYGMARMISSFYDLLKIREHFRDFILITPVHARLGNLAYGTSPGEGVIHLTLRSYMNEDMESMTGMLESIIDEIAAEEGLKTEITYEEDFPATVNDKRCTRFIASGVKESGYELEYLDKPFKWSEDFGHFTARFPGALFGLGSGISQPALHNPDYDFPDALIPVGMNLYKNIYQEILMD